MNNKGAAEILKTDCCAECSWQPESAVTCGAFNCNYKKAVEVAIAALEKSEADGWISVEDRLPDKNGKCLVSLDFGDVCIDFYDKDWGFVCYVGNVTHWRPLPPKPYESEEGGNT